MKDKLVKEVTISLFMQHYIDNVCIELKLSKEKKEIMIEMAQNDITKWYNS